MWKLIIFVLLVFAAWTAWKKYPTAFERQPKHEARIENASGSQVMRVRLRVGDQTLVKEVIEPGQSATIPFAVNHDEPLGIDWQLPDGGERHWDKGRVVAGPMLQIHKIRIEPGDRIIYETRPKPSAS